MTISMDSTITKSFKSIDSIKKYYIESELPLVVAFSGGKDSTVTLDLTFRALAEIPKELRNKKTYVVFSDTKMEMDPVIDDINKAIESAQRFADEYGLDVEIRRVEPEKTETFFALTIGRGYVMPRRDNRFCTDRFKIKPQEKLINEIIGAHNGFISIVGSRKAESFDRKQRLEVKTIEGMLKEHDLANCYILAPIEDWGSSEVWNYLYMHSQEWVDENALGRVYSLAAGDGDECRSLFEGLEEGATPGCGKSARYGCWVCTLFEEDKTLKNLGKEYAFLRDKEEFRNWLVEHKDDNWQNRDIYSHRYYNELNYNKDNHRFGMVRPGGMNIAFREEMLERLLEVEKKIFHQNGGKYLVSDNELEYIQSCWIEEGDLQYKVVDIAKKYGREVAVSESDAEIVYFGAVLLMATCSLQIKPEDRLSFFSKQTINARYATQAVIQLMQKHPKDYQEIILGLRGISTTYTTHQAIKEVLLLPVETQQFYPTKEREEYIKHEWKEDSIGYWTFLENIEKGYTASTKAKNLLEEYDGVYAYHYKVKEEIEQKGDSFDVIDSETMSLNDQCAFFDNWNKERQDDIKTINQYRVLEKQETPISLLEAEMTSKEISAIVNSIKDEKKLEIS